MMVTFKRPDGGECQGFSIQKAGGVRAPGVVVIQEWWGVNDQIRGVAEKLVENGYRALVPDLYRGTVTLDTREAEHLMTNLDFVDAATQDLVGAVQFLKQTSPKVGVLGFCMGGALTILTAMHAAEASAAVSWYGVPPEEAVDPGAIRMPLQGHFGTRDSFFPIGQVDAFERRLQEARVEYEFFRYDAEHAFGNETGPHYNAKATRLAWERTLTFLGTHLQS